MATVSARETRRADARGMPGQGLRLGDWRSPRLAIFVLSVALTLIGATGETMHHVFHDQSTLKYAITVAAPAFVAMLALIRDPLRVLVCLGIFTIPINYVSTLEGIAVTPVVAVSLLALPLALMRRRQRGAGWLGPGAVAIGLLLAPSIVNGNPSSGYINWIGVTLIVGWLAYGVAAESGGTRSILWTLAITGGFQGLVAVYEYKTGHTLNLYSSSGTSAYGQHYFYNFGGAKRSVGTFEDPISMGNVEAMILPLIVSLSVAERDLRARVFLAGAGGVTALGAILSYSRDSWIGGTVAVVVAVGLLPRGVRIRTATAVLAAAVVFGSIGISTGGKALQTRFSSILNPTNSSSVAYRGTAAGDKLREREWSGSWHVYTSNLAIGVGMGNLLPELGRQGVDVNGGANAQNEYLQILAEAGSVGALALIVMFLCIGRDLIVAFDRHRVLAAGIAGSTIALMISWFTDVTVRSTTVSCIDAVIFGMLAAAGGTSAWGWWSRRLAEPPPVIPLRVTPAQVIPPLAIATPPAPVPVAAPVPAAPPAPVPVAAPGPVAGPGPAAAPAPAMGSAAARPEAARPAPALEEPPTLVLATGSVDLTRQLKRLRVPFLTRVVDDSEPEMSDPSHSVRRSALHRALAATRADANEIVIGVATRVAIDGVAFSAPTTPGEARALLERLSGRTHEVRSAVALVHAEGVRLATTTTTVTMCELSPEQIEWYVGTREWAGRSTGYDPEGLGSILIRRVEGDYQNITGLPLDALLNVCPSVFQE